MISRETLFTDETENFKTPYEPKAGDSVTLTFRTMINDVNRVYAVINGTQHKMKKSAIKSESFDYYTYTFKCRGKAVSYYFEIEDEDDRIYYNRLGPVNSNQDEYNFGFVVGLSLIHI